MKISLEIILSTVFAVIVGIEGQYGPRLYRRVNNNYNNRYQDENIDDLVKQLSQNGLVVEPRYKPYLYGLGGALLGAATAGVLKNKKETGGVGTNKPLIISQVQDIPICIVTSNKKKKRRKKNRSYNGRSTLTESEMQYVRQILSSITKERNSNYYTAENDSTLPNTSDDEGLEEQEEQTKERKPQNYSPLLMAVLKSKKSKRRRGNKQPSKYSEGYTDDGDDLHNSDEDEDEYYNKPNIQRRRKHKIKDNEDEESEIEAYDDDDDPDEDGDEKHNDSYEDDENEDDKDEETYIRNIVRHGKRKKRKRHHETINCITIKHKYSLIKSGGNPHQQHGFHSGNDLYGLHQYIGIDNNQYHQLPSGVSSFLSGIPLLSNLVGLKGRGDDGAIQ